MTLHLLRNLLVPKADLELPPRAHTTQKGRFGNKVDRAEPILPVLVLPQLVEGRSFLRLPVQPSPGTSL